MSNVGKGEASGSNGHHGIVAVIPAYNEERFIGSVVLKTRQYADAVIVVDDGSIDATGKITEAAGAVVVQHAQNQGKGVALSPGFCRARELDPAVVVTLDADGQHSPEEVTRVAAPVLDGQANIVVSSRYLEKKSRVPLHRTWGHIVFNFLTNRVSGVPVTIHYHDKPKRPVVIHGLLVLNGILRLMGQRHPLLFFGLPSTLTLLAGLLWGIRVVGVYGRTQVLAVGYVLLSMLLFIIGSLGIFAGITLHSTRELILELVRSSDVT
jgi:glycosyltransferase involved in cell wall biosynthesis